MASTTAVAVSGVTGFVGAQVAAALLARGYTVHGTVRRNTPEKVAHLTSLTVPGELKVFEADLNVPDSFDEAVRGCTYAMHVASPFSMNVADAQKDLVDPAINGTLSFLKSCKKAGVAKVVLTSSLAAIADSGTHGKVVDESVWNESSTVKHMPYYYSKTAAEKAAWNFVEEEAPGMKLVVINPVIVFGPSMVKGINESASLLVDTCKGKMFGIVDIEFPVVDVRDVAEAHCRAMESDAADGRYICYAGRLVPHREVVEIAVSEGLKPPTIDLTSSIVSAMIKASSYVLPGGDAGAYVRGHMGNPIIPTNEKIVKDLGMTFRDPSETIKDSLKDLIKRGHLAQT